jgi:hypothetical protein
MSTERSRRAAATFRQGIGEAAFVEHMLSLRAKRRDFGKPFRLDYGDKQGRTGSEIAAAGKIGGKMRAYNHKQEIRSEQNQNQPSAVNCEPVLCGSVHNHEPGHIRRTQ